MFSLTIVGVLVAAGWPTAGEDTATRSVWRSRAVIALTHCDGRSHRELVMAVWGDGRAIWSDDPVRGGPPYREGRVDPKRVAALLDQLTEDGLFDEKSLAVGHTSTHFSYHALTVRAGARTLDMATSHELGREKPREPGAEGRTESRLARLRKSSAAALFYELVWAETRVRLANLLPREGRPANGSLTLTFDVNPWDLVWRDDPEQAPPPRPVR